VVAACVYIPKDAHQEKFWASVNDSKKLSEKKRETLYDLIIAHTSYGIAESTVEEIDQINILQASLLAMSRSLDLMKANFSVTPEIALVDGNQKPKLPCRIQTVVKGDSISLSIAAASILAKVTRDRIMGELCQKFPMYGWSQNAGYGTANHLQAISEYGITDHHRRSFAPVKATIAV
jgi:ribonuclease HII